jgi:hypothetical protein
VAQQVWLHMHDPCEPYLTAAKRVLCYLQGTLDHDLLHWASDLFVYTDADWVGCPDTHRSTPGYTVFLGDNLISWSSKHWNVVSRSSTEAEYRAVANVVADACCLRHLLVESCTSLCRRPLWPIATTSTLSLYEPCLARAH